MQSASILALKGVLGEVYPNLEDLAKRGGFPDETVKKLSGDLDVDEKKVYYCLANCIVY